MKKNVCWPEMSFWSRIISAVVLLAVACVTGACQSLGDAVSISHIEANVPADQDFDNFLKRDLEKYFQEVKKRSVVVDYELLRKGPTQSGTAFPKFYAWVIVKEDGTVIEDGAVKVAAMEKKQFAVYDYLSRSEIESDVENLYRVFPAAVADKIKEKLGK